MGESAGLPYLWYASDNAIMKEQAIRTTVDIPISLYRKLKAQAAAQGRSIRELILLGVRVTLVEGKRPRSRRVKFPLIVSDGPKVDLTNEQIYEHLEFPWRQRLVGASLEPPRPLGEGWSVVWTQIAVLRLLTTPTVMGSDVKTMSEAWALWDKICADDRIALLAEPEAIEPEFRRFSALRSSSPNVWTDACLVAFGAVAGLKLITFDRGLRSLGTDVHVL
jgi:predicted nucleic acid-binding protein